jgi:hypothetical protein
MWHTLAQNPQAIRELFGHAPSLERFTVVALALHEDGPQFTVRGDLSTFPTSPPARWSPEFNTVQLVLDFWGVRDVSITAWSSENAVDLSIRRTDSALIECTGVGPNTRFTVLSEWFRIATLSGYESEA